MEQKAQVLRLLDNGRAELLVRRASACGSCHNCESHEVCMVKEQTLTVTADNPVFAQPGDTVSVQTSTRRVLLAATVVYLLPPVLFIGGYLAGEALQFFPFWLGAAALAMAGAFAFLYNRRAQKRQSIQYTVSSIEKE